MIPPFEYEGQTKFLGFAASQNRYAMPAWSYFFEKVQPARILEVGTSVGGMTVLLGVVAKQIGAKLTTFDIVDKPPEEHSKWFDFLAIESVNGDVFSDVPNARLASLIEEPGQVVLLCDGGNKVREFNEFSMHLKLGDYIAAHDWHFDDDWPWREIRYEDVAEVRQQRWLQEVYQTTFERTGWRVFQRGTA